LFRQAGGVNLIKGMKIAVILAVSRKIFANTVRMRPLAFLAKFGCYTQTFRQERT
jgi:hypothetical protein